MDWQTKRRRDEIARAVLQGLAANPNVVGHDADPDDNECIQTAIRWADLLVAGLDK